MDAPPLDDHSLWAAAGDGDRAAFTTLYPPARGRLVARYPDTSGALLFTAPPDVTAMRVAAEGGTPGAVDCPLIDGLAMCTLDVEDGQVVVVTASTAADPQGVPVYWG